MRGSPSAGGKFVSPRAEACYSPKTVCKSSLPVWFTRALLAMPLRLLAMHFPLMLCFGLSDRLIAARYDAGHC
jgi:hypothetical protein